MPATWKILGAWALVILPKVVGLNTFAAGLPKLGWLRTLKASSLRVKASCSYSGKLRLKDESILKNLGPTKPLRGEFP